MNKLFISVNASTERFYRILHIYASHIHITKHAFQLSVRLYLLTFPADTMNTCMYSGCWFASSLKCSV